MEAIQYPTSMEDIERLVLALYDPSSINCVAQIQATLHRAQKSPEGWRIAHDLLGRQDEKVQFFGVLTFIVKLNTESSSLGPSEAVELRDTLLQWLISYAQENTSKLVLQKLSSALVTFYLRFPKYWDHAIRHILSALSTGSVDLSAIAISDIKPSPQALSLALMFASDLAEEATKLDANSTSNIELFKGLKDNMEDTSFLVMSGIRLHASNPALHHSVAETSVKCLQAWVFLYQKSLPKELEVQNVFRSLILTVLEMMTNTHQQYPAAIEFMVELLQSNSDLPTMEHYDVVYKFVLGPIGQSCYSNLLARDFDFENVQYGQLVVSLADSQVTKIVMETGDQEAQLLEILSGLLNTEGYPAVDDKLFVPVIELWCTIAEAISDEGLTVDDVPNVAIKYLATVSQMVCRKIVLPPPDELAVWDSSDKDAFASARRDVSDFLEAAHASLGKELLSFYGQFMLEKLKLSQWRELEAVAYSLGAFSYCLARDDTTDDIVSPIFSEDLFALLHPSNDKMPPRCRQTCIGLIEKLSGFFQRHVDRLPSALTVLFSVIGDSSLTTSAARSIYELCDSCKEVLMPEASGFIEQYRSMMRDRVVECITLERLAGAIASILQAIPEEATQIQYVTQMVEVVEADIDLSLRLVSDTSLWQISNITRCSSRCCSGVERHELASHVAVRALRSLLFMARDLRSAIDYTRSDTEEVVVSPDLQALQSRLMQILIGIQRAFSNNSEIVEGIFHILRVGISESTPGPFVFPVDQVTNYVVSQTFDTPRIGLVIASACSLASSLSQQKGINAEFILTELTNWVINLLARIPDLDDDVEIAQNSFNFIEKAVNTVPNTLLLLKTQSPEHLDVLFTIGVNVLYSKEPLVKTATLDFWATFFGHPIPVDTGNVYREAVDKLGPNVVRALMDNVGGNASRSELDKIALPIKKMFTTKPQAKAWFEAALASPEFPSQKVTDADKSMFLKKLVLSRGNRNTNQIIRDFWLACRGAQFAYVS